MIHLAQSITYQLAIEENGREVALFPAKKNLLTDAGLDLIGNSNKHPLDLIKQVSIGTGDTPTKRDSGAITFSASGGTVTASAGFFEAQDVGRLLKWDSGPAKYLTSYMSPTQCGYAGGPDVAAAPGTVWYVNRQTLAALYDYFTTLAKSGDPAFNGSTAAGSTISHKRTMVSAPMAAPVVIKEIGWGPVNGATLFGLDLLPAPIALAVGQQLRVRLTFEQTLPDITQLHAVPNVGTGGIDTAGTTSFDFVSWANITGIYTTAGDISQGIGGCLFTHRGNGEPCPLVAQTAAYVQTPGGTVKTPPSGPNLNGYAWTLGNYVNGSRVASRSAKWNAGTFNGETVHALIMAGSDGYSQTNVWSLKPAAPFTVSSEQELAVTFEWSWDRVLINT